MTMTDRELLEFAAKAAGIKYDEYHSLGCYLSNWAMTPDGSRYWNPLTNDGDAFRLGMKLRMCIDAVQGADAVQYFHSGLAQVLHSEIDITADDYQAAARRAITCAAAEIGKAQP